MNAGFATRSTFEAVWILVRKELSLHRRAVGIYACLATAGAVLVLTPVPLLQSLGLSSMLAVLIGLAVTLGMIFVVGNGAFQFLPGTSFGLYFWSAIEGGVGAYLWIMASLLAELLGSVWLAARLTERKASWL